MEIEKQKTSPPPNGFLRRKVLLQSADIFSILEKSDRDMDGSAQQKEEYAMGFFGGDFKRPGPGIPHNLPPKKGLALLWDILCREGWPLVTLNLLYLLCCLPVVTIGPATAALSRLTITMVRDRNVYPVRDFLEAFRSNWKQGLLFGLPATGVCLLGVVALPMALSMGGWMAAVTPAALLLSLAIGLYLFPLAANVELFSADLLRNAVLLVFLGGGRTVGAVLTLLLLHGGTFLLFPFSLPWLVVFHCAFSSLVASLWIWPVILRYAVRPEDQEKS